MSRREFTPQQQTAIDHRATSVVLSAGAGSGKTRVLTERYLAHLDRDGAFAHQLVAITFTEKAAREMRDRIRTAVEKRCDNGDDPWQAHLRGLETAAICTIHSFCGTLLRDHALAAGLDPRFEILEEVIAPNLREAATRETLLRLLTDDGPEGAALRSLVRCYGWQKTRDTVAELLSSRDSAGWDE